MKHAITAALILGAGAAQAGGPVLVVDEPPVAVPQKIDDWTGIYLGLNAVYGAFVLPLSGLGGELEGYGLHAGYLRDFGDLVLGAELTYVSGNIDFIDTSWASTQLRLIGGYDAGRVLAYGFLGASRHETDLAILGGGGGFRSDMMLMYGVGAKLAVSRHLTVGAEYFVERGNDFDSSGTDIYNNGLALSVDYRFSGVPMAAVSPSSDWTGFYLGLTGVTGSFLLSSTQADGTGGLGLHAGYLRDFGSFVLGGELAYASGNYDFFYDAGDWTSTQLKLIGGYDVGRAMPYGFVGLSRHQADGIIVGGARSDTMTLYGLGTKLTVTPKVAVGMEYFIETNNDFDNSGFELENSGLALSVDYRF